MIERVGTIETMRLLSRDDYYQRIVDYEFILYRCSVLFRFLSRTNRRIINNATNVQAQDTR